MEQANEGRVDRDIVWIDDPFFIVQVIQHFSYGGLLLDTRILWRDLPLFFADN